MVTAITTSDTVSHRSVSVVTKIALVFFSHPWSDGWPHCGRTISIYLCPRSCWLTFPWGVLSRSCCCPSMPCMAFLACIHLAFFLVLSLSPGNSLVSSWCDHSILPTLLWRCLTVHSLLQLCQEPTHLFSLLSTKPTESFSSLLLKGVKTCFFILSQPCRPH